MNLSYQGFSPSILDAAMAYPLPPHFVMALENLYSTISSTISVICRDAVVYDTPLDRPKLAKHLNLVLERHFNRNPEAGFWMQLNTRGEYYSINIDENLISYASSTEWDFVGKVPLPQPVAKIPMGIVHLGHAGVSIKENKTVLIDPVFYNFDTEPNIELINCRAFDKIDAIFFTHFHGDHFDLATLAQIERHTKIYVPNPMKASLEPDMKRLLGGMGFTNVSEVSFGERIQLTDDSYIDIMPFFGEGRESVGFEAYCPLYTSPQRRILFHADSGPNIDNESLLASELLEKSVSSDGPIDTIFGSWWQGRSFLYQLSPKILATKNYTTLDWLRTSENCDCNTDYLAQLIQKVGAKKFVAYAEGGANRFYSIEKQSHGVASYAFFWRPLVSCAQDVTQKANVGFLEANPRQIL